MAALHVGGGVAIAFDVLERLLVQKQHEVKYLSSWNGGFEGCHMNFYNEYKHIKPCIENYFRLHYEIKLADIVVCHSNMFSHIAAIECYIQSNHLFTVHILISLLLLNQIVKTYLPTVFLKDWIIFGII